MADFGDDNETDEDSGRSVPVRTYERRRYPPPFLDFGVVQGAKLAGWILAPLAIVAGLFGLYLEGFRANIRNDIQVVVKQAVREHIESEKGLYGTNSDLAHLKTEVEKLRVHQEQMDMKLDELNVSIIRLTEKVGRR